MPPLPSAQIQAQRPEPVTEDELAAEQRFVVGALARFIPFELLRLPLTTRGGGLGGGIEELYPP